MKDIKILLTKLDGLQQKKAELVKQRDQEKEAAAEIRKKTGYDLLEGIDIDKAGAELLKNQARIETLTSAVNAVAATIAQVEADIYEAKKEQAQKDINALGKEADALLFGMFEALEKIALDGKRLAEMEGQGRGLLELTGNRPGTALKHSCGYAIQKGIENIFDALRNVDQRAIEIRGRIK